MTLLGCCSLGVWKSTGRLGFFIGKGVFGTGIRRRVCDKFINIELPMMLCTA
ncbi:hypothetical protein GDO86_003829 [Hymenochirus boettgeri]|uniref:Uncharacterized protein n=1 Tax=Hymenochirus boettgeri TaxID=247094 RepID=A0A8T2K821_9PIPI|nr:hypothetical protein GDO86_003829 [Hymenochirus boettgeri]